MVVKDTYFKKALKLIHSVENYIGFDTKTGLLKDKVETADNHLDAFENISLSIAYLLIGREKDANNLILKVEDFIGFDEKTQLIKNKIGSENIFLSDNALLALAYFLLSKKHKAHNILNAIETYIGFEEETGLARNGLNSPELYSFNSLLMAIDYLIFGYLEKGKKIFDSICTYIGFDQKTHLLKGIGNKKEKLRSRGIFTLDNALLVIYYVLTDKWDEAEKTILSIESYIEFDSATGLARKGINSGPSDLYSYVNNILAIAYLSLATYLTKKLYDLSFDYKLNKENNK